MTSRKLLENAGICSDLLQTACSTVIRLVPYVRRWLTMAETPEREASSPLQRGPPEPSQDGLLTGAVLLGDDGLACTRARRE
eukprot:13363342-Alexandrium_andersonii.AAC.1